MQSKKKYFQYLKRYGGAGSPKVIGLKPVYCMDEPPAAKCAP